ncbi:hypothetical protein FCM35_KLT03171 [Carex littledalei]|uniref:Uncharacterized protein n=1 Tax=Carex littledalei TaxID=544730 RepID=A0A833QSM6_9POAL|nr:hypothetical protein FCM35_KLT03171 [Carex littledalei]
MAIYALHKAVDDIEVNKPEAGDEKTNLEKRSRGQTEEFESEEKEYSKRCRGSSKSKDKAR